MADRPKSDETLLLDRRRGLLFDGQGRCFDPAARLWQAPPTDAPAGSGDALERLSVEAAAAWLQRDSAGPLRVPVGVIGPREASAAQDAAAEALGRGLARMGLVVLCGGREGVMAAVCRGVAAEGGLSLGLLPDETWETANPHVGVALATGLGAARNAVIARAAFCLVAIGGGHGTLSGRLNSRFVCICDRIPGTSGGWIMDIRGFQVWLSAARGLTRAQRREALAVLSGRSEGEASKAAIELGVDEARRCPHCASEGAVSRGMARGLRRYQCKGCGRTFNALSGTPLSGLHHKERWLSFGASLAKGETVKASAARCDVAVSTAFRWRHRFLAAARSDSEVLKGIVEADETYVLESRKGARGLGRKARRRGGKAKKRGLSREQVPVLMAADRSGTTVSAVLPRVDAAALTAALDPVVAKDALLVSDGGASYPPCAAALGVSHEALNRSMGERVRGDLHVQTVNSRHSRLKDFLRPRRGIATRYLDNYLSWFHLVGLAPGANDRACLAAAVTR